MATFFSDNFDRTDSTNLGSSWTEQANDWSIASNRLSGTSGGSEALCYYNGDIGTADYSAQADFISNVNLYQSIIVRRTAATTGYFLYEYNGDMALDREVSGSWSTLATYSGQYTAGATYKLDVSGTGATVTLKAYKNGVQMGTDYSDTNASRITGQGYAGFNFWASGTMVYDNFQVDTAGEEPATFIPTNIIMTINTKFFGS